MKVGNERPVDAVAARVVATGESFEYLSNDTTHDSDLPLPVTPATKAQKMNPTFVDFTGRNFGRLVVLGISANKRARWVCKCVCGRYSLRSSSAISAADIHACCDQCYLLAVSKRKEYERRTGSYSHTKDFLV